MTFPMRAEEDCMTSVVDDELVILGLESGELFSLEGTGRFVWDRLDGTRDLATLTQQCAAHFDADPASVASDIEGFVADLRWARLVRVLATPRLAVSPDGS